MSERRIVRTWTPNGWLERFEPAWDPEEVRRIVERHPMTPEERLAASLRYVRAEYERRRAAAWARWRG
jgi:hypothetical protein